MISQETIEKIKGTANLIEIIGESVPLRRQGRNFVGLCPFHSEKSGSFNIRESGEAYHCFGCGKSGNAISYVMETRGLSFPEAVEDLAARYGIEVKYEGKFKKGEFKSNAEDLYRANHIALRFFTSSLNSSDARVKDYVRSRGINDLSLKTFQVGFAPPSWNALADYLQSQKVDLELAVRAGLLGRSSKGTLIDRFRGRLIFPIFIDGVRIAGFGGRLIPELSDDADKNSPKYLNSPESEIYKKSKTFFGLPQAGVAIRESGVVYLVEGYMDVIGLWQAGVKNSIATCGTSVTEEHIRRIGNLAKRCVVLFDGDQAGRTAAAKLFPLTVHSEIDFVAKFLSEKDDPDTFAKTHADKTLEALEDLTSLPLFDCFLSSLIEDNSVDGELGTQSKGRVVKAVVSVLSKLPADRAVVRGEYLDKTAARLRLPTEELERMLLSASARAADTLPDPRRAPADSAAIEPRSWSRVSALPLLEQELLKAVIALRAQVVDEVLRNPLLVSSVEPSTRQFIEALSEISAQEIKDEARKERVKLLLDDCGPDWKELWLVAMRMREDSMADLPGALKGCFDSLKKNQMERELKRLDLEIRATDDDLLKAQLGQEQLKLRRILGAPPAR